MTDQGTDPLMAFVSAYADLCADLAGVTTGRTRRGPNGAVLAISGAPIASLNAIISPSSEPSAEEIEALAATEGPWELPWTIHVRGIPSPSISEAAARLGRTSQSQLPLMVRSSDRGLPAEALADDLLVRVVPGNEMDLYVTTLAEGFEGPPEAFQIFGEPALAEVDGFTFYLAELDGVPVGTGFTATSGDLTGIYNITTLPRFRQRGYGRAVTLEMVRAGFAAGAATAYLYASEMGESVYRSAGFRTLEHLTVFAAPPSDVPAPSAMSSTSISDDRLQADPSAWSPPAGHVIGC
ncbi:GNAT family N-acetyltransferase [Actinoplanes sp. M2I2]|uniref:GNAT family N-acetyltransferase n=1 Tax=Actinoplanes sp. M2I2 TaxID=1734444 RepID=UPI002020A92E|nr:GNAT family N-acetyltransferase [Actinoplanes sp. M2I2]